MYLASWRNKHEPATKIWMEVGRLIALVGGNVLTAFKVAMILALEAHPSKTHLLKV